MSDRDPAAPGPRAPETPGSLAPRAPRDPATDPAVGDVWAGATAGSVAVVTDADPWVTVRHWKLGRGREIGVSGGPRELWRPWSGWVYLGRVDAPGDLNVPPDEPSPARTALRDAALLLLRGRDAARR